MAGCSISIRACLNLGQRFVVRNQARKSCIVVVWFMTPCCFLRGEYHLFGGTYCIHLQGWSEPSAQVDTVSFSGTRLPTYHTSEKCHIPYHHSVSWYVIAFNDALGTVLFIKPESHNEVFWLLFYSGMKLQDTTTIYSCVAMCNQGVYCMQTPQRKCFTIWLGTHFKLIWGTSWRKPTMEHTSSLKNISLNRDVLEFIPEVFILCVVVTKKAHRSILIKCFVWMQGILSVYFISF